MSGINALNLAEWHARMAEIERDDQMRHFHHAASQFLLSLGSNEVSSMADAIEKYAEWCGGVHDEDCPQDDTCACSVHWINDGVNEAVGFLRGLK